jgi:hypothetical protein
MFSIIAIVGARHEGVAIGGDEDSGPLGFHFLVTLVMVVSNSEGR